MSHFERTEGAEDNLGNNPKFVNTEELAIDSSLTPDEILMAQEENYVQEDKIEDFDNEPSNWEDDVESGKYDQYKPNVSVESVSINPVRHESKRNITQIEEMKGREQLEKYWDVPSRKVDNSKRKRSEDGKDSIRFDEAV